MKKRIGVMLVIGVALITGAVFLFRSARHQGPDKIPEGSLTRQTPPSGMNRIAAEGRIVACPDAEVLLRSEYAGTIDHYPARELQTVKKGDLLASIRAEDMQARLAKAMASLDLATARFGFAEKQFHRDQRLRRTRTLSQVSFDRAKKNYEMAKAMREKAQATIGLYQSILAKTRILAPINGVIVERFHNEGEYVHVGSRIVRIVDLDRTRIDAEVDEFDAGRVALSDPVTIRAEGYPVPWKGVVVSISDRVSRKHLIPDDPSRPTDTGIVHVKVAPIARLPYKLGQKVDVKIYTEALDRKLSPKIEGVKRCRGE